MSTLFDELKTLTADFQALEVRLDHEKPDRVVAAMNRPEVLNAIDQTMVNEFHALCQWLEDHPHTLIITGTEAPHPKDPTRTRGIFASGADIAQLRERRRHDALRGVNSKIFNRINELPMPVIAAIDGFALGGGAELAWAADFRIASTKVRFSQPETNLGISPAAGAMWRIKELAGETIALELLLTGRMLNAEEALQYRLINSIHEPEDLMDAAHELADKIAEQDQLAVQVTKRVFKLPREAHPWADDLGQAILFESEAKFDRMQTFLDRRKK
ncbi:enoyl-CoA hydratase/isomerase family protein [Enteractinococcus coprophilus]|uniref:Enoyl-CoA hydratase/carnithine racemase n=1 Tax=Enteractinococcus coprophilus TaxID=1027633 RepID=A0A543AN57_9MICC|nr:enoyl-CoA hydratase/isomerase family protein [Enteractinococcus coprophilus]TQL74021.1 enoyl-CoA hydratase/carnithine racemase [Enteractinococcus coprophilus]